MQDNWGNKASEAEYLDQSWHKMSQLLNEQMPHAMPPRPSRPNYELLLLLALFSWTVYLYWPESTKKILPEKSKTEESTPAIAEANANSNVAIASLDIETENLTGKNKLGIENEIKSEQVREFDLVQIKNSIQTSTFKNDISVKSIADNRTEYTPLVEPSKFTLPSIERSTNIAPLALLQNKSSVIELDKARAPFKLIPSTPEKRFKFGIRASEIVDRNKYSGFAAGIFAEYDLNNRFALFTAVEWHSVKKVNPAENSFSAAEDFFNLTPSTRQDQDALGAGMSILYGTNDPDSKFKVLGVEHMNYLTVPVELIFKVNKRMRVNFGASFSYLASAVMQNDNREGGWSSKTNVDETQGLPTYGKDLLGTAINRFDVAPSIGFSFRPIDRLTLDLKFRNGIIDISKDDFFGAQEYHSNRYLHLGLGIDILR